jgi:hypothetical protein
MAARTRGTPTRASYRLMTGLLCPVALLLLGACGDASSEETQGSLATPRARPSSAPPAPSSPAPSEKPRTSPRSPQAPGGPAAPGGRPKGSNGPVAAGSPLRIPLPVDELLGRELSNAEAQLEGLIADACGGDQCISLRTEPRGSLDPDGRSGCATHVVRVPGTVWEDSGEGWSLPVLYIPRGGVISLVVELWCDEGAETEPGDPPSPEPTPTMSPETESGDIPSDVPTATMTP